MITKIEIENFKSLKKINVEMKRLNLLMGLNGMGKSSLIQSILMLRQSRDLQSGRIQLNNGYVSIGKGRDAMYQYSKQDLIRINIFFSELNSIELDIKYNPENNYLQSNKTFQSETLKLNSIFNSNFQYLKAERMGPQTDYPTSTIDVIEDKQIGIDGKYTTQYLNTYGNEKIINDKLFHPKAKSKTLIHQVDAWLSEITPGVKLNTTEIPGTDKVLLDYQFETGTLYTNRFRPANVGFGLSYVLPVIVALLSTNTDKLIIIENPESHIHPRGQVELGKLIALAANSGAQLIVETHSDHILNGIRVAVKEKLINKKDVGVFYFDRITNEEEQYSRVIDIKIDDKGELSEYPSTFMDEWSNQLLKLL